MINVACLEPQYFAAILAGRKRTERRDRKRIDPILEKIRSGEACVLLEKRSMRGLIAPIRHVKRFARDGQYRYCVRLGRPQLINARGLKHLQGWQRRASL